MNQNNKITAAFDNLYEFLNAVKYLKSQNKKFIIYTPIPSHEIEELLTLKKSKVAWFTLIGAILGLITGFGLAIYTSAQWNLILGGKPPISLIPFVVIGFEFTILFGAISTLIGLIYFGKFPKYKKFDGYKSDFTVDKFGVFIEGSENEINNLKDKLISFGAKEFFYD